MSCDGMGYISLGVVGKTCRMSVLPMRAMCEVALPHAKHGAPTISHRSIAAYTGIPQLVCRSSISPINPPFLLV